MFIDFEAGQDKILHYALQVAESDRALWFNKLRIYIASRIPITSRASKRDLNTIFELIDDTEAAIK